MAITTGKVFHVPFRKPAEPVPLFAVRTPVEPMELRRFWTAQFQRWAARPGHRLRMPDGTSRDKAKLMAAICGLLDNMRKEGALRGSNGFWNVDQLAEFMGMTRRIAFDTLQMLEQEKALVVVPVHDERGHRQTSERYMRIPAGAVKPQVHRASSGVDLGEAEP